MVKQGIMYSKHVLKCIGSIMVVDIIKMTWNVGSVKIESRRKTQWWSEKREWKLIFCCVLHVCKAVRCNECEAGRVDYDTWRGLRSSNPLIIVAIQTVDIFIKGCYLLCPDVLSQDICFWLGLKSTIFLQAWAHQTTSV